MASLIIISYVCWILGFIVNGFTLYNVLVFITTTMFTIKKLGVFCKLKNIITWECVFLIFSTLWRLLFHKLVFTRLLLTVVIRLVFIAISVYDDKFYVYVSKEIKDGKEVRNS